MKDKRRDQRAYRRASERLRAKGKRLGLPCSLCREPIDYDLPHTDRLSYTADHVEPLAVGGAILGPLRPAHRSCNGRKGDGSRVKRIPTTREW